MPTLGITRVILPAPPLPSRPPCQVEPPSLVVTREHGVVSTSTTARRAGASAPTGGTPDRARLAAAGLLTGAAGLAVSELVSALLRQRLTPRTAVAEAVVEKTPGRVAVTLVHLVGHWDKPILLTGVLVVLAALSAAAGVVSRGGLWRGRLVFVLLAAVAAAAVLTRS